VEVVLQLMMEGTMDVLKLVVVVSCVCCVDVIIVLDDGIVDVVVVEYDCGSGRGGFWREGSTSNGG
jgi:hypothetical protein